MILARRSENRDLGSIPLTESMWYHAYISCPQTNDRRFQQKFRRRFRLPYKNFLQFVEDATEGNWFPRWKQSTRAGKDSSPLELLILGAFRYLGRGFTFDDCEESTGISEEVHRVFFHKFIERKPSSKVTECSQYQELQRRQFFPSPSRLFPPRKPIALSCIFNEL